LPAGLVPFNVEDVNGDLYVAYVVAGPPPAAANAPEGSGAIAVFDTSGNFIKQLTAGGKLASPWGITLAPTSFGKFGGDLLVGNFSYAATLEVHGGAGPNCFSISPFSNSLATITALLTINGSGSDVISFWDQLNPASETYNFDPVPSMVTLTTLPVEVDFSGMGGGVYLQTNGTSTVNDVSGTVIVDGSPPC
jgi:hypothetical protein